MADSQKPKGEGESSSMASSLLNNFTVIALGALLAYILAISHVEMSGLKTQSSHLTKEIESLRRQVKMLQKQLPENTNSRDGSKALSGGGGVEQMLQDVQAELSEDLESVLRTHQDLATKVENAKHQSRTTEEKVFELSSSFQVEIETLRRSVNELLQEHNTTQRLLDRLENNPESLQPRRVPGGEAAAGGSSQGSFVDSSGRDIQTPPTVQREPGQPREMYELADFGFKQALDAGHTMVVMFYAPWCPHCKMIMAAYEAANQESDIPFARLNGDEFPEIMQQEQVKGFPTIRRYARGAINQEYNGDRSVASLIEFGRNK